MTRPALYHFCYQCRFPSPVSGMKWRQFVMCFLSISFRLSLLTKKVKFKEKTFLWMLNIENAWFTVSEYLLLLNRFIYCTRYVPRDVILAIRWYKIRRCNRVKSKSMYVFFMTFDIVLSSTAAETNVDEILLMLNKLIMFITAILALHTIITWHLNNKI